MWQYIHSRVGMVVSDGVVLIWHQDNCNHRDDETPLAYIRSGQHKDDSLIVHIIIHFSSVVPRNSVFISLLSSQYIIDS